MQLIYQENGGFVFALKKAELEGAGGELPSVFVNVTMQKGRWLFSCLELVRYCCHSFRADNGATNRKK